MQLVVFSVAVEILLEHREVNKVLARLARNWDELCQVVGCRLSSCCLTQCYIGRTCTLEWLLVLLFTVGVVIFVVSLRSVTADSEVLCLNILIILNY